MNTFTSTHTTSTVEQSFTQDLPIIFLALIQTLAEQQATIATLTQASPDALTPAQEAPASVVTSPHYNSDSDTLALIRNYIRAQKPDGMQQPDYALALTLLPFKADDHAVTFSQTTLKEYMACSEKTVARSEKALKALGIISQSDPRPGHAKTTVINIKKLPLAGQLKEPTEDAKRLVYHYMKSLKENFLNSKSFETIKKYGKKHRTAYGFKQFDKNWIDRQERQAQKMLDKCNGDIKAAARVISHARTNPKFTWAFKKDLYNVRSCWSNIMKAMAEEDAAKEASIAQQAAAPPPPVEGPIDKENLYVYECDKAI
jgi:hypothetical protein